MDPRSVTAAVAAPDETAPASNDTRDAASTGERPRAPVGAALPVVPEHQYELGGEHARGGLGRILRGRDQRLDRPVAIKELLRENAVTRARFLREARITARLQHPGVVPIYEAGVWPSGQPFYAMRLVDGQPLSAAIAAAATLGDRLALLPRVLVVAETMAYAHDQGIIHRDLKPSNILVGAYGETVVIDWGIAKQLDEPDDADAPIEAPVDASLTRTGQVLGTPWYMAPEQARGAAVGKPADVYALGAILYHLLSGAPPHSGITDQVVQAVAAGVAPPALTARVPGLPADLVAIVDKALAVDPAARYPSAADLAADLKRFLAGQLVTVHRYTLGALLRRWVGRHRAAVAVGTAALVALAVGGAISVANIVDARDDARHQQAIAATRADEVSAQRDQLILAQAESALERDPTDALAWLKKYPASGAEWNRVRSIAADAQSRGVARLVLDHGEEVHSLAMSAGGTVLATASDHHVMTWSPITGRQEFAATLPDARLVAVSRDGLTVAAAAAEDHRIRVWTPGRREPHLLTGHTARVNDVELLPEGHVVSAAQDQTLRVWTASGKEVRTWRIPAVDWPVHAVFSTGTRVVFVDSAGALRRVALDGGEDVVLGSVVGTPRAVALSADDNLVAVADDEGVRVWPSAGGAPRRVGTRGQAVAMLRFSNGLLVAAGTGTSLAVWRLSDGREWTLTGHEQPVQALAISARGDIASGDVEGEVRIWRYVAGIDAYTATARSGHRMTIEDLMFSPEGDCLVSASEDYGVRVWNVPLPSDTVRYLDAGDLFQLAYAEGGRSIITTARSGAVRRSEGTGSTREISRHGPPAYAVAVGDGGRTVATASWDGSIFVWNTSTAVLATPRRGGDVIWSVDVSSDGRWLAAGGDGGAYLGPSAGPLVPLGHEGSISSVEFSPDGGVLATLGEDATVRLWTVPGGAPQRTLRGHAARVSRSSFTTDGRRLVTVGWDGEVRLWARATGNGALLGRHRGVARAVAVSPDGRYAATGGADRTVRLWDLASHREIVLGVHEGDVRDVAFSPDGTQLASAGYDATVRLWHLATRSSVPLRGERRFHRVAFRPDGGEVAATSQDGTLRVWRLPIDSVPVEPAAIRDWLDDATTARRAGSVPAGSAADRTRGGRDR